MRLDKQQIERLYLKGYNYLEIANTFKWKPESVRKCIQRNFKDLKSNHEAERERRKAIDKALNREVNSFMSGRSFVKTNPSVYKQNNKGDLVLKKGTVCYTNDTPKVLRNEELREYEKTFLVY